MKKKVMMIIAVVLVVLAAGTGIGYYVYSNRFIYNEEGDTGNTTGNLYNGGMFCVYDGFVYFSNPDDNGRLYRMKEDGSGSERIGKDSVSCLNICNGYVYYVRDNMAGSVSFVSVDMSHGVSRLKLGDKNAEVLHNGISDALMLCGNDLYYRAYSKSTGGYYMRKVGIDGSTDESLFEKSYLMIDYADGKIFFSNDGENHNLMFYTVESGKVSECYAGNFYMPDCEDGYIYYIDLDNGHKISRLSTSTLKNEVLSDDYAVIYNVNARTGEIYYQAENAADDHRLCKMNTDGSGQDTVLKGDYTDINFTEDYVYFYQINGNDYTLYRAALSGGAPDIYHPAVDK